MSTRTDYFPGYFDPSGQAEAYMFQLLLDDGVALNSATVNVVDYYDAVLNDPTAPQISNVSFGVINASANLWGVTFYVTGGTAKQTYFIRCRYTTTQTPAQGSDITLKLRVDNT